LFNDEKVIVPEKAVLGKGYLYIYERAWDWKKIELKIWFYHIA
jgi:hypothetical protein